MNKRQKIVQQQFLNNEEEVLKRLKATYNQAFQDVTQNIKKLQLDIDGLEKLWEDFDGTDEEKAILQSRIQSKIYQKQYQEAIRGQLDDVLGKMQQQSFLTVSDYLTKCYEDGFVGTMFDLQGQGIPLIFPIDQESVTRAVQLDSKISGGLYKRMGEDVSALKKVITAEVSRGIATGKSFEQVAQQIQMKMTGTKYKSGGAMARAMTIARTEGHRIQCQAGMDACYKAKEKGADIVKQWDATLDAKTRESHQHVDGEIRELDKPFSNGLMFAGDPSGGAAEVVNCRCALLQRARWALDEDELKVLEERAAFFGVDKTANFDDFKKQYLKAANVLTNNVSNDRMKMNIQLFASKEKQFGKKVGRHAKDFGLDPSKAEDREKFRLIIDDIITNADEVRVGNWRCQDDEVLFYIKEKNVVVTKKNKEFITILEGGIDNARVKKARNK